MPRSGRWWKPCPNHPPASHPPGLPRHTGTSVPLATVVAGPTFERRTVGDRHRAHASSGVWPNLGQVYVARGAAALRVAALGWRGDPRQLPRQASPAQAIALLGGALAGSGPGTSPCVDGLSLVTGMVVPQRPAYPNHAHDGGCWTTGHDGGGMWRPLAPGVMELVRGGWRGGIRTPTVTVRTRPARPKPQLHRGNGRGRRPFR